MKLVVMFGFAAYVRSTLDSAAIFVEPRRRRVYVAPPARLQKKAPVRERRVEDQKEKQIVEVCDAKPCVVLGPEKPGAYCI